MKFTINYINTESFEHTMGEFVINLSLESTPERSFDEMILNLDAYKASDFLMTEKTVDKVSNLLYLNFLDGAPTTMQLYGITIFALC